MKDEEMRKYQGSIYEEHAGPGKQGSVARIREATQQQVRTREVADNCPRVRHCDDDDDGASLGQHDTKQEAENYVFQDAEALHKAAGKLQDNIRKLCNLHNETGDCCSQNNNTIQQQKR